MNRLTLMLVFSFFLGGNLLAIPNLNDSVPATLSIHFQQYTYSEVKAEAALQQKPFFVYFYGDTSLACQTMTETTFTDQRLGLYIQENFVAVKVDIHSTLGKNWDKEFKITSLPTFIIFDERGNSTNRLEGSTTASALYQLLLESMDANSEVPETNHEVVVAAMIQQENNNVNTWEPKAHIENTTVKRFYCNGIYKIQLGAYTDYSEAIKVVENLESDFPEKEVFLLIDKKGNYTIYRILVMGFNNQKEANDFLEVLGLTGD